MQRLFAPEGPWPTPLMTRVLPHVIQLVEHAPTQTVFTRFVPPRAVSEAHGMWRAYYRKWPETVLEQIDPALIELMPELQRFIPPAMLSTRAPIRRSRMPGCIRVCNAVASRH